jgi:hypothetical protein
MLVIANELAIAGALLAFRIAEVVRMRVRVLGKAAFGIQEAPRPDQTSPGAGRAVAGIALQGRIRLWRHHFTSIHVPPHRRMIREE